MTSFDYKSHLTHFPQIYEKRPEMPFTRFGHCAVTLNSTMVYLFGGYNENEQFQSDIIMLFDGIRDKWIGINSGRVPCQPPKIGYQMSCALYVMLLYIYMLGGSGWNPPLYCSVTHS